MFELGWIEIGLIGVIALVVLGPERMPKAARFAGLWVRKARAQWFAVKSELEREIAAEELKASLQAEREAIRDAVRQLDDEAKTMRDDVQDAVRLEAPPALSSGDAEAPRDGVQRAPDDPPLRP
jgi:sec-independent protein translocase protein TatB